MLLSDVEILKRARENEMIWPINSGDTKGEISSGVSSYGYDIRVGNTFKIFSRTGTGIIDPKNFNEKILLSIVGTYCILPPHSFALAQTVEYFKMPRDVLGLVVGKSTYARCGLIINCTPIEPEFQGTITLEISNTTPLPAKVYSNEGIGQLLFFQSNNSCSKSYKDKDGKYQGQQDITLPFVK